MSLNIEGEKCGVCNAYLFEEDDVVYCPECGAPHHRECYNSVGHCGLQQLHGTENQYKRVDKQTQEIEIEPDIQKSSRFAEEREVRCGMCGNTYLASENSCPECGAPNVSRMGGRFVMFDFLGGVPADMDLGEGVTADEAKRFVSANTHRYIPKFASFKAGKRASWNWLAFLAPSAWFLSRKMYKAGAFIGTLQVALSLLILPFTKAVYQIDTSSAVNYMELGELIMENLPMIGEIALITAFIASTLNLILSIFMGAFGDIIYKKHVITTIADIKVKSADIEEDFRRKGGISFVLCLLGLFAVQELPSIIAMLAGL